MWCWLALAAAHASPHGILTESNAPAQAVYEESYADSLSLVVALANDNNNDPALYGLSNELPYVSPDLLVVSTSNKNNNYMDSSVCSNSSTSLGSSLALSSSHDSQIEIVLYPQKSMRSQLSNITSFDYLRKLMTTGAAADVLRPAI